MEVIGLSAIPFKGLTSAIQISRSSTQYRKHLLFFFRHSQVRSNRFLSFRCVPPPDPSLHWSSPKKTKVACVSSSAVGYGGYGGDDGVGSGGRGRRGDGESSGGGTQSKSIGMKIEDPPALEGDAIVIDVGVSGSFFSY